MKDEIIYTDDYALIVSDEHIKDVRPFMGQYHLEGGLTINKFPNYLTDLGACKLIIAHRPLTNAPILEGVALLPEFGQEEDVKKISEKQFYLEMESPLFEELGVTKKIQKAILVGMLQGTFTRGYNKAKETYKYTEEDLRECCSLIFNALGVGDDITTDEIIQHIQQPKRPKYFEMEVYSYDNPEYNTYPKTKLISQGQTELVGKYIF
jgi:hypothetical protein